MPGARFFARSDRPPQDGLRREDASLVTRAVRPGPATIATRSICPSSRQGRLPLARKLCVAGQANSMSAVCHSNSVPLRQMACKMTATSRHHPMCPGRGAARSDAPQSRDPRWTPEQQRIAGVARSDPERARSIRGTPSRHINKSIGYETSGMPAGVAAFYFAWGCFRFFVPALRAPGAADLPLHINRSIRCGISGMSAGGIG